MIRVEQRLPGTLDTLNLLICPQVLFTTKVLIFSSCRHLSWSTTLHTRFRARGWGNESHSAAAFANKWKRYKAESLRWKRKLQIYLWWRLLRTRPQKSLQSKRMIVVVGPQLSGLSPGVPAWISLFPYTLSRGFLQLQLMTVQQVEVSANSK